MKAKVLGLAAVALLTLSSAAWAQGDPAEGEKVFKKCKACHTVDGKNRVGPTLQGVFGRQAGTVEDFRYSDDLRAAGEAGLVWTEETLAAYLKKDKDGGLKAFVGSYIGKDKAKTRMAFPGFSDDEDIANLIAHLKSATQ